MTEIDRGESHLTVRRTFDAPRERVWAAWTDPAQVDRWWGPEGFTTETDELDVRPGGEWRFAMTGPDGEEYPNLIRFDEVEEPELLGYTHGEPDDPEQFRVTVTLKDGGDPDDEEGDGETTALTMEMRFPSADDLDEAVEFGADDGARQTLGRLAEHLEAGATSGAGGDL